MSNPSFQVIDEDANEPARDDEERRDGYAQLLERGITVVGAGPAPSRRRRRSRRSFGSVERLSSGRFRARVVGPDGKYVSAPTTFTTRTDASLWVDVQHADLVRGAWKAPLKRSVSPSVGAFVEQWIAEHPTARESTKELYRGLLRTCITPTLGRTGVGSLTAASVRRWHHRLGERLAVDAEHRRAELAKKGREGSAASVRDGATRQAQAYRLLRAVMSTAVTDGLLQTNPCTIRGAATPRRAIGRSRPVVERLLSPVQVADAAAAMPPRYRVLVLMAAWSGLRQGELLALTRADVDLDASQARVMVRKAVRRADSGQVRVDVPKTASSVRAVTLPDPLAAALRGHLEQFVPDGPDVLVFATSTGTTPARSNLGATWRRACVKAGIPQVRLHDLRHVAQVFAAEAGATLPELMARLGHATPAAAMVYLHARNERDAQLTSALGQAMAVTLPIRGAGVEQGDRP